MTTTTTNRKARRTMVGKVVSDKMQKTIVVTVESLRTHPLYGKTVRRTKRYKAHDEDNSAQLGDLVEIAESRPLSKDKHWTLVRILNRKAVPARADELEGA